MPKPLNVNREAIKTLVIAHGVREGARLAGLNESTVQRWSAHYGWLKNQVKTLQPIYNQTPSNALVTTLAKNERQTRLSLSRAHRIHAARAARGKLSPKETLQTAQGAAITHQWRSGEKTDQTQVAVNIAILGV